ncbi:MAG TPA: hypothetical protein DCF62_05210 [Porticoccaceae bacterium]|nr:hypothetical protein [Porticoccaceae bacterium]HCO58796.1 hypothetical protein [Porticoccaceae bacterium]
MKLGVSIRTMGPQSTRDTITECAIQAEQLGFDSIWLPEHIAIPPDDAEGSEGRYLDPLITLAYLAAKTERIKLATGALILPYRPPLVTAKLVATLQELAKGRLMLGVGIGWMRSEFKALGLNLRKRVGDAEAVLEFIHRAFANDVVELNGQPFYFRPRPERPPIYIGGAPPHAIARAVKYGDGWLPMRLTPDMLKPRVEQYRKLARDGGNSRAEVVLMTALPTDDSKRCKALCAAYAAVGVDVLVYSDRYDNLEQQQQRMAMIAKAWPRP